LPRGNDAVEIFLQPGEYFVGGAGFRVRTVLGSCVSVTLWHPQKRIGAMSHFLLANKVGPLTHPLDPRYGDQAILLMLAELVRHEVPPPECHVKLFGGGNMFPHHPNGNGDANVGQKNGQHARSLIRLLGLLIVSESLFGVGHRQIIFDLATGHVWSRQIKPNEPEEPHGLGTKAAS